MWDFTGSRSSRVDATINQYPGTRVSLAPAKWVWLPSERTLPNTVVLFRRAVDIVGTPSAASIELTAESRYRLWVNGELLQFGPAPADPRWPDVDTVDLSSVVAEGRNEFIVEVLYYGHGDGTWVMGTPGLIARGQIQADDQLAIATDESWECRVDRARTPVRPKRWFLRALQEVYDQRRAAEDERRPWHRARELDCEADQPAICSDYPDYLAASAPQKPAACFLRRRQIPPLDTSAVAYASPLYADRISWNGDPEDWYDYRVPNLFEFGAELSVDPAVEIPAAASERDAAVVTYDLGAQIVGWPLIDVEAPEGTIIEISLQEGHDPRKTHWLDTHLFRWIRYICDSGRRVFETFEYDSVRYLQLHVRSNCDVVRVHSVGVRQRRYRFGAELSVATGDRGLARLFDACGNTVMNAVQETLVDCVGRERQQYAGDVSHEMPRFLITAYDEYLHPRRYLRTYSEGVTSFGYFMDTWPGVDRTIRVPQRMMGLTNWGPILDHSVGFVFDSYNYYFYSGDLESLAEVYPAICAFIEYLSDSLPYTEIFPVEGLGIPSVWMDHQAYQLQRHKQCAFNLYVVAMLRHAFAPLADAIGDDGNAHGARMMAQRVLDATIKRFWSDDHGVYVANLPWLVEEDETRMCDRSLATSLLFDLCPGGTSRTSLDYLIEMPPVVGRSYVPNQMWRHQAIAKAGRTDVLLKEYRSVWAKMRSVVDNQTVSEHWSVRPDSADQYSHNGVVPLMILFSEIAGIKPTEVGFVEYEVRPQLADLKSLDLTYHTPFGPIEFSSRLRGGSHTITIDTPRGCSGTMRVAKDARADASLIPESFLENESAGESSYSLTDGDRLEITIPATLQR